MEKELGQSCDTTTRWWERDDLGYRGGILFLAGESLEHIAHAAGKPVFVYSAARIDANLGRLRSALDLLGRNSRVFYAMKANRFPPILEHLRSTGLDGIDVCSPGELQLARQTGFPEEAISFTGTSVSNADLDVLAAHPAVWVNCDSLSSIRRLGERSPGRTIGLRINQRAGIGYGDKDRLRYSGAVVTKFGIYPEQMDEALSLADRFGLKIGGLHFHAGCGYLDPQLPEFREVLEKSRPFLEKVPDLAHVNLGGGLGVPILEGDDPLDLGAWAALVDEVFADFPVEIWIEPGDYLVKDAGALVLEVNTVEEKGGCGFVGVNGGFNLHIEPAFYDLPLQVAPCRVRNRSGSRKVTVVGNINEALDVFAADVLLPPVEEGDYLAFLNAGGYGSSMSSNHCMRGDFAEYLIIQQGKENEGL